MIFAFGSPFRNPFNFSKKSRDFISHVIIDFFVSSHQILTNETCTMYVKALGRPLLVKSKFIKDKDNMFSMYLK